MTVTVTVKVVPTQLSDDIGTKLYTTSSAVVVVLVHSSKSIASDDKFVPTTALELPATNPASGVIAVSS